jgi:hypothetical protein
MPDELQRWSRALTQPADKGTFQAQHQTNEKNFSIEENPHRIEAQRERQYLIWISLVVILAVAAGGLGWLLLR